MPRTIQTFLPDSTLEGVRIIELSESNINGWTEWKNADGKTMDEIMRRGAA